MITEAEIFKTNYGEIISSYLDVYETISYANIYQIAILFALFL